MRKWWPFLLSWSSLTDGHRQRDRETDRKTERQRDRETETQYLVVLAGDAKVVAVLAVLVQLDGFVRFELQIISNLVGERERRERERERERERREREGAEEERETKEEEK
jgi:hypothetical protein